jgi:2-iminobutanoate/2-iminopropanoate deaminase
VTAPSRLDRLDAGAHHDPMRRAASLPILLLILAACRSPGPSHLAAEGALGPYSGSVVAGGLCFASGKIGAPGGRFEDEVSRAIDALEAELGRRGLGLGDLVQVTVYLTDMELYAPLNAVYAARIPAPHPARACVAVAGLPGGARVEIVGLARLRPGP